MRDKKVLVTGASRGIGAAVASCFHDMGAQVFGTRTTVKDTIVPCDDWLEVDFNNEGQTAAFLEKIQNLEIDVLINNAGINKIGSLTDISDDEFLRIQKVNSHAPFRTCQAVIPNMTEKAWGRIVNVSSIWGKISKEFRASYSSSKFALDGMTAAISAEYASKGILANCVAPGFTRTELTETVLGDEGMAELSKKVPIQRLAEPEEIARFIAWLGGDQNTYISGQNIAIDGGFTRV
jgi:3-oxoacyl-[acyl-carrier protein] reductase